MRRLAIGFLVGLVVLASGCGGYQSGTSFAVLPHNATTTVGGTVKLTIIVANGDAVSYSYEVVGGSGNGMVTPVFNDHSRAVYQAPQVAGTYTIHAGFTLFTGETDSGDITITVQ